MRNTKAFLSCSMVVAGLLSAPAIRAEEADLPLSCTTPSGWNIVVSQGPCTTTQTTSNSPLTCSASGLNTGIEYVVTQPSSAGATPDHVFTLVHVTHDGDVLFAGSSPEGAIFPICVGDSLSGVGLYACHEQAVRLNPESGKANGFKVVVKGRRDPIATSVVVKKGKVTDSCKIKGLGLEVAVEADGGACVSSCGNFNPNQTITKVEIIKFKGCDVQFVFDTTTGRVVPGGFTLAADNSTLHTCQVTEGLVAGNITIEGGILGTSNTNVSFGDGWVSSGNDSCSTRFVAGRYYTVCQ